MNYLKKAGKFYLTGCLFAGLLLHAGTVTASGLQASLLTVPLVKSSGGTIAQQYSRISGVVVDKTTGEPVIGANVVVKGTTIGTGTDFDGNFSFEGPANATLVVSYIGYINQEIVASASPMRILLVEDAHALDEIVVVGYGVQKKESLTGALSSLKSDKITTMTSPNVENMLSGKAPGVFVAPGTGEPGEVGTIVIRGQSSINGKTAPLWVIDGVIVGYASDRSLNTADIESMTILKDAASTAIYGSQGTNGVIVVTTKKASSEQVRISVSAKLGANKLSNGKLKVMNGAELYDYYSSFSNQEEISFPRWNSDLRNSNYDWWDLTTQTGMTQDYNISLSGGSEKSKSYFSLGLYDEESAIKGSDFQKYSIRFRNEYKIFDRLTIRPMFSGSREKRKNKPYDVTAMYAYLPWDSPYLEDGTPTPHKSSTWVNSNKTNYLYDLQWNKSSYDRYSMMANLDLDFRITDWLTFSTVNNYTWNDYSFHRLTDPRSNSGSGVNGRVEELSRNIRRRYSNHLLRFNHSFGKHSVNGIVAYEYNDYKYKNVDAVGVGFVPGFDLLEVTAKPEKTAGKLEESAMQSYFFNGNYAYDNKYLAQISFRRDGASNFGDDNKYGNFFSISGGWNVHREEFMEGMTWIDQLKLRLSYGTTGNTPDSYYPQYDLYAADKKYSYNEVSGLLISQVGNNNLTWEKTHTLGVGLDFDFLKRFHVNLDYYNSRTKDQLMKVPVSGLTGVTSIWQNIGEVENYGIDLSLGADIITTKDWYWGANFNLNANKNKIKELYGDVDEIIRGIGTIAGSVKQLLAPGKRIDTFYAQEWAGVNPENGAPQWYRTNTDGKRVITENYAEADQVELGSYSPKVFGGFSTDLRWKQFDLGAVFSYSIGGKIYNYSRQEYDSDGAYTDRNQMKLKSGWSRWEKPGDKATHPIASYGNKTNSNKVSSRYIEKGDFLKLRSLTLGYNLNLPNWYIKDVRLSFTAENLFTITGYSGVDPEIPTTTEGKITGVTGAASRPISRKFLFGINFTL